VVGVPLIASGEGLSVRPGGSEPLTIENMCGSTPPLAARPELYATATCAVTATQVSVIELPSP
jgi:hypothetical protein